MSRINSNFSYKLNVNLLHFAFLLVTVTLLKQRFTSYTLETEKGLAEPRYRGSPIHRHFKSRVCIQNLYSVSLDEVQISIHKCTIY